MAHFDTPVLIVGGGGFGLSTSIFLSHFGVPSMLVERHATPSPMPKARYLNQRTMEIFRQHGVADAIYARSLPLKSMSTTRWVTSLGGDGPHDRRLLYEMDVFGGGALQAHYRANSPCESTIYPQVRLEPLLRGVAQALPTGTLRFAHDFLDLTQDADGVTARIEDRTTGERHTVRARYLVAADGGKSIGAQVGATLTGTPELMHMVTVYFRADLSAHLDCDDFFACWMANPAGDTGAWGSGVLGKLGPTRFDRHSEEWMFHFSFRPDDPARLDEAALVPKMRALMQLPELQPEILGVGHWVVQGVLADRWRFGRVLLGGDAAHRHTPTTGLGLNSAIQDAQNLAWKLALVLTGRAGEALVDAYESERRPAAARNVDWALFTFSNHQLTGAAIGLVPGDAARSRANFEALLAAGPDGESRRHRFREVMKLHDTEYQANDLEIGVRYEIGALVPDGTPPAPLDPTGKHYVPSTRPGHRLPHAWLQRDGQPVSTLDLVPRDGFLLLAGPQGAHWAQAARRAAERMGLVIAVVQVDAPGDVHDVEGRWQRIREFGDEGAVLVRPDQIVAWRAMGAHPDASTHLESVLRAVLRRPAPVQ